MGIIRSLEKIGRGFNALTVSLCCIAVIACIGAAAWLWHESKDDNLLFGSDDKIDYTPTLVESMRSIGQWEFLSISDEEIVDTVRKGFFSDSELVRIYYGTLRLGIDFSTCSKDWIKADKDTIRITLPEIRLLDENFIDEARTKSFFETGKWTNKDRKDMYERARILMRKRCLTKHNISTARDNARAQVKQMLQPMVEPKVIKIEK